jgi:hypothetical protein
MQAALPDGWTQAEYEWLSALGQARDPARLLDQNRDWQRAAWVQAKLDALQGLTPDAMQRLTPAVQGLIRLADRLGVLELRCYARERRLDFALALYDLRTVSPVMRELAALAAARLVRASGGRLAHAGGAVSHTGRVGAGAASRATRTTPPRSSWATRRSSGNASILWRSLPTLQAT